MITLCDESDFDNVSSVIVRRRAIVRSKVLRLTFPDDERRSDTFWQHVLQNREILPFQIPIYFFNRLFTLYIKPFSTITDLILGRDRSPSQQPENPWPRNGHGQTLNPCWGTSCSRLGSPRHHGRRTLRIQRFA